MTTLGQHLVNAILPEGYRPDGPLTKARLQAILIRLGRERPHDYPEIVTKLKRLGDELSTTEGISVGLKDISTDTAERDRIMKPFEKRFNTAKNDADKEHILVEAQNAALDLTKTHQGSLAEMARSGGRGNMAQLMRIVTTPVMGRDAKDRPIPWLVTRSYAEGLKPSDTWVMGTEARMNALKTYTSVVEPGDLSKILINNMSDQLVTTTDCGTDNGLSMSPRDSSVLDRFLARPVGSFPKNTLLTPQVVSSLGKHTENIIVRSPMTCRASHGVCQKCQGLTSNGKIAPVGTNVGMRAAQAMAEPMTQLALSAKHSAHVGRGGTPEGPEGIKGIRQFLEVPKSFTRAAIIADRAGTVDRVTPAPQGGHDVFVDGQRHYVSPDQNVTVRAGQKVSAGDVLSNGIPKPDDIVRHKGLGAGRDYLVGALHGVYKNAGVDIDRRHMETLARSVLNHVQIVDPKQTSFLKGDIIDYNRYKDALHEHHEVVPIDQAIGKTLADEVLHHTAGSPITKDMLAPLRAAGFHHLAVATQPPEVAFVMRPASRNPLLHPDFMGRLAHRYLREGLVGGAHRGDTSDIHGYHPAPAYAAGTEFGLGEEGRY